MPAYIYKARDAAGRPIKGRMESASRDELIDKLRKMGYMATHVTQVVPTINIKSIFERWQMVSTEDIIMFNVQLSNMINAGISILTSLDTLNRQIGNKKLKKAVGTIVKDIEGGDSFSEALSRHPRIFSKLFINMVKAGEASGRLGAVLARFAEFSEQQADLREKIRGALFYPAILLCAGIGVTLFIVTFVIPQFAQIFMKAGLRLPLPTLILYKIGMTIKHFWYFIVLSFIALFLWIRYYINTYRGRLNFDTFKLRAPLIGSLHLKAAISRFTRTLGTLLGSGVPILQSLSIVQEVIANRILANVIGNVYIYVEKGERLADPLKISGEFPLDAVQMISVGEETGNLAGMLNKISDFYDMSIGYAIKKLTTILEPLFLVIMGSLVAFIMLSMLMPIFDMIKILRH